MTTSPWKITLQDCINKTGQIESGTPLHKTKTDKNKGNSHDDTNIQVFKFGKYRGKSYDWVKKNDIGYWNWACDNIKGFNNKI